MQLTTILNRWLFSRFWNASSSVTVRRPFGPATVTRAPFEMARLAGESEVFVIGGGQVYAQALPLAQRLYLTRVHATLVAAQARVVLNFGRLTRVLAKRDHPAHALAAAGGDVIAARTMT